MFQYISQQRQIIRSYYSNYRIIGVRIIGVRLRIIANYRGHTNYRGHKLSGSKLSGSDCQNYRGQTVNNTNYRGQTVNNKLPALPALFFDYSDQFLYHQKSALLSTTNLLPCQAHRLRTDSTVIKPYRSLGHTRYWRPLPRLVTW